MSKQIWFKAKGYGYGWYPVSKEGWLILLTYLILFTILIILFAKTKSWSIYSFIFILTAILIFICYRKGEKAKWRWGNDRSSNKHKRIKR